MSGPLSGIRILDLTSVVLGPLATMTLGDMGAEVTKVEPFEGDVMRHVAPSRNPGMGAIFLNLNRNKRSMALNLKQPRAGDIVRRLAERADVVMHSMRPKAAKRLGIDYESLLSVNPRVVYCGVRGFGKGPYADLPALDDVIQAGSGIAHIQGAGGHPRFVNTILADKTTGLQAAMAVAMALYERERSGQGQEVVVPMFEAMIQFVAIEHLQGLTFDPPLGEAGYKRVLSPHRGPYATMDGHISVLPYTDQQWQRFFALIGRPDLAADERVATASQRSRNVEWVQNILVETLVTRKTADWIEALRESDIPTMPINSLGDLFEDEHVRDIRLLRHETHPSEGEIRQYGIPIRFGRTPGDVRCLAPRLGEHSREILAECGYTDAEIASLLDADICRVAS